MKIMFNSFRIGLFFLFGLALLYVTYTLLADKRFEGESGYYLTAAFHNLKTLGLHADVRMAGVKIGTVRSIELVDGQGMIRMLIDKKYQIPRDSVASIGIAGLLGQNYIIIDYGSKQAGFLSNGQSLSTKSSADFNDIIGKVEELGNKLNTLADNFSTSVGIPGTSGSGSPGNLFANLNSLITENRSKIDGIISNFDQISSDLNRGTGTLGKLLKQEETYHKVNQAIDQLQSAAASAERMLAEAQSILAQVKQGEGTLGALIYKDDTLKKLNQILADVAEFSQKLKSGDGTIGKLLNDDTLYRELRSFLNTAEKSLGSMGDSGPITAVGVAANALF